MHDGLTVHVVDAVANLPDEENAISLGQSKVVGDDSLKKLAARDAEIGYQLLLPSKECYTCSRDSNHNQP